MVAGAVKILLAEGDNAADMVAMGMVGSGGEHAIEFLARLVVGPLGFLAHRCLEQVFDLGRVESGRCLGLAVPPDEGGGESGNGFFRGLLVAETDDPVGKRLTHRGEMGSVVAMAEDRAVIERLGDLGIARGAGVAAILVESETGGIEIDANEAQDPPHLAFRIGDDVLVTDREVAERHLAPVMGDEVHHQPVMSSDGFQFGCAIKSVGEMVGEDREDDVERMADEVDDRGVGKEEADQPEMHLVERHLVGDEAYPFLAREPGPAHRAEVMIAQELEIVTVVGHPGLAQRLRIGKRASEQSRGVVGEIGDEGKLIAAIDVGVRGEDLLDQRGSRPGKAHDENRAW